MFAHLVRSRITVLMIVFIGFIGHPGFAEVDDLSESLAPLPDALSSADKAKVIVKVGEESVTAGEVDAMVRVLSSRSAHGGGPAIDRERIINQLIDKKVVLTLAKKAGATVSDEELNVVIAELEKRRDPGTFEKMLQKQNMTKEQYFETIRPDFMVKKFIEEKFKDLKPTQEEVAAEYERLKATGKLKRPESVDFSHILAKVATQEGVTSEAANDEAKKTIEAARKRIVEGGEDFEKVAREVSQDPLVAQNGGAYQRMTRGSMPPEIEKVVFESSLGQVSEPFKSAIGWHIARVKAKYAAGDDPIETAAPIIARQLARFKQNEKLKETVEEAKKSLTIERLEAPTAPPPASAEPTPPAADPLLNQAT